MKSIWNENSVFPSFESLKKDTKTDVLIIGAGICGILTAYQLHQKGINYILVEKNRICSETTQNTTAKITFQHGLLYSDLLKKHGYEKTKGYLDGNRLALETFFSLCKDIDCDFEVKNNFVYSTKDAKKIENELAALQKIGCEAFFYEYLPLPIKTKGAVCIKNQAQFNPLKFLSQISKNLNIYENTFVKEMIGTSAVTDNCRISADKVIVTTHFPFINKHGLYPLKLYQHRSYVSAFENAPDVNGMYLDEDEKGLSFRNYKNTLLLGGGSHRTGKRGGNWNELRRFANKNLPDAKEVLFWATQDCMSLDNIPYIGQYSKSTPNLFVATGFNKWGMTSSMLSSLILADLITEKDNEFAHIFSPSRNIFTPKLATNAIESIVNLLNFSTKRCPHLGCALKWNNTEHSWDCPCHGSRFDGKGNVLDNPANGNMKM